jgi:hypothetical protein
MHFRMVQSTFLLAFDLIVVFMLRASNYWIICSNRTGKAEQPNIVWKDGVLRLLRLGRGQLVAGIGKKSERFLSRWPQNMTRIITRASPIPKQAKPSGSPRFGEKGKNDPSRCQANAFGWSAVACGRCRSSPSCGTRWQVDQSEFTGGRRVGSRHHCNHVHS